MTKKTNGRSKPQEPSPFEQPVDSMARKREHIETLGVDSTNFDRAIEQVQRLFERLSPRHLKACSRPLCAGNVVAVLDAADGRFERLCERHFELAMRVLELDSPPINDPWRREFESLPPALQYGLEGR